MRVVWTTLKKELASYFFNPVAYVIAVLFYLYRGFEVRAMMLSYARFGVDRDIFSTSYIFNNSTIFMVVLVPPILTMRTFAEERRTGSLEVLLTAPVREWEVVLGKLGAAVLFFGVLWLPTLPLLWVLSQGPFVNADLAYGPVLSGYLGLFLLGALYLSVGCLTSSLTDNVLLASLSAMLFNFALLYGVSIVRQLYGREVEPGSWQATLIEQIDVTDHLQNWFARGLIDSGQVAFYVLGVAFFAFLTVRSLESRTWR